MQFQHPELLWALLLLLIPIIIHLFQLRRFRKTPFTNVKFLKKVVSESRRSNRLKKWLLLLTRMGMLAALVVAFAQPFFAEKSALQSKETVIYLDNSFSMQAKSDGSTLLENAVQSLIQSVPKDQKVTLFTNEKVFKETTLSEVQNELLAMEPTTKQLRLDQIYLKAGTFFEQDSESIRNLVLVSDFQKRMLLPDAKTDSADTFADNVRRIQKYIVPLSPELVGNVSIDSIYLETQNTENIELTALVSRIGSIENTPVSLFNRTQLIAKTAAVFKENNQAEVRFTLPKNEMIEGKLEVSDSGLTYDNQLYFTINTNEKIKILAIGDGNSDFLKRIYNDEEFSLSATALKNLNYSNLENQNLIVLNEIPSIPTALVNSLRSFTEEGGSLTIIPAVDADLASYNLLTSDYVSTSLMQKVVSERSITNISFSHPLYRNVFEKNVSNFQSPKVQQYFQIKTLAPNILSFQDKSPFLIGGDGFYLFTASLSSENSNFRNSPLIVPTIYQMGSNSLKTPPLYAILGQGFTVDVSISLSDDSILKAKQGDYEFIPKQQAYSNKVSLNFDENLKKDGQYAILEEDTILKNISFNYDRAESDLTYLNLETMEGISKASSIAALFNTLEKDNRIDALWKWFVILALVFLLIEIVLQKFVG